MRCLMPIQAICRFRRLLIRYATDAIAAFFLSAADAAADYLY